MLKIDYEDPILKDTALICLAKEALGDKRFGKRGDVELEIVWKWLHTDVPLLRGLNVSKPKELRESDRKEELMLALQVINNDIKPNIFFDYIKIQKEELIAI